MEEEVNWLSLSLLSKDINCIHEGSTLITYCLPKAPPSDAVKLRVKFQLSNLSRTQRFIAAGKRIFGMRKSRLQSGNMYLSSDNSVNFRMPRGEHPA